jgi:hypothetical protein
VNRGGVCRDTTHIEVCAPEVCILYEVCIVCVGVMSKDCVSTSLDICFDLFALVALASALTATHVHLENVDRANPKELINVWYANAECSTARFVHMLKCTEYTHRVQSQCHMPRQAQRFSVVLPMDMIRQLAALLECCDTEHFLHRNGDLLRIGSDGTIWLCTGLGCRMSIDVVCCNAKVRWE